MDRPPRKKRQKLRITCEHGRPQQVDGYIITVRRKKRGDRYTVAIEPISQLTDTPPQVNNPDSR